MLIMSFLLLFSHTQNNECLVEQTIQLVEQTQQVVEQTMQ